MDFDMLFEEGGTSQTAPSSHSHSHPQTHMALRLLRRLCTTEDEKLRKVLELVRESLLVLNAEELQQRHLVVQTAKKALELAGYTTRVVTSGRKGQLCFRHTYLQLVGQGVNEDEPKPFIVVEPLLREELQIVRPTEQYQRLLDTVPQVFVGTLSRLSALIEFVTARMEESFREQGMCTPPWRQIRSLLAKWDLASSVGLQKAYMNIVPQLVIGAPCKDSTNIHKTQDIHIPDDDKRPVLQKASGGTVNVVGGSFKSGLRVLLGSQHCSGTVRQGNLFRGNAREHGGMQGSFTGTRVK
eukprot:CAMPEP_0198199182 /NCGR_PEP_ID=MMETSP1445-20131203/2511_1 /TAXON_ID=36898 /ORGANISM="Pyramimonas sp., Strain CCMP2087" /LENGTH=297 /DNA_ID=CAMNT_0043868947 /DNA_START=205 /DNA_END=1098 /DNA_ORIENTATION=+